jgi:hypothetical protein
LKLECKAVVNIHSGFPDILKPGHFFGSESGMTYAFCCQAYQLPIKFFLALWDLAGYAQIWG